MSLTKEKPPLKNKIFGWTAVGLVTAISGFWAYWGGIESFHEGWYSQSIWENLFIMFIQYWLFTIIFMVLGLLGLRFKKTTAFLCAILGVAAAVLFEGAHFTVLWLSINIPFIILGLLFYYGAVEPKWLAKAIMIGVPALILLITTVQGVAMVSSRIDDGDYGARTVAGNNGVCLVWAPEGPGWPQNGCLYEEALNICAHLSEDGTEVLDEEVNIWRLPSVEEAVASMALHGENAGGVWSAETQKATYVLKPDKETPLWKPHSQIIYYWTSTLASLSEAYIVIYHGGVFTRNIDRNYGGSMGFRAVKDCE